MDAKSGQAMVNKILNTTFLHPFQRLNRTNKIHDSREPVVGAGQQPPMIRRPAQKRMVKEQERSKTKHQKNTKKGNKKQLLGEMP